MHQLPALDAREGPGGFLRSWRREKQRLTLEELKDDAHCKSYCQSRRRLKDLDIGPFRFLKTDLLEGIGVGETAVLPSQED